MISSTILTEHAHMDASGSEKPKWGKGGRAIMKITADCPTATLTKARVRSFEIIIDEPQSNRGEDLGPQPLEYLLGSLAGCTNVILNKICHDGGLSIDDLKVDVTGVIDTRGILGEENVRVPFPEVRLTVKGRTRNSVEQIEAAREELAWRCPVKVIIKESGSLIMETWEIEHI